jgi:uncharacterized coiled-coil DUF342 family protein
MEPSGENDLRALYETLLSEKDKRDSANLAVKQAVDDLKMLKEERDRINKEVAQAKERRNSARTEGKRLLDEAKKLREMLKGVDLPRGSSEALGKLIERLDFTYQTKPMPFDQERQLVKKIEELRIVLRTKRVFERKNENLSSLSGDVNSLFTESRKLHEELLTKAGESERVHKLVIEKAREIDALRKKSDAAHLNVLRLSAELGEARAEERQEKARERATEVLEREKHLHEKARELKKQLTGKKTFNLRDLQVIGAAGEDFDFGGDNSSEEKSK